MNHLFKASPDADEPDSSYKLIKFVLIKIKKTYFFAANGVIIADPSKKNQIQII